MAVRAWGDPDAAQRLSARVVAVAEDGGLRRADASLLRKGAAIAEQHGISVYDAAYVAAARDGGGQLVSCDVRDLVSRGLACLPAEVTVPG